MKYNNDENKLNEDIFTEEEIEALKLLARREIEKKEQYKKKSKVYKKIINWCDY